MESLLSFLGRSGYLPHGVCIAWSPPLLWSFVAADLTIAAAYFSIPLAIGHYGRRRDLGAQAWVAWLFSAFILACGLTHLLDVWTLWNPDYGLQVAGKLAAAALSLITALALWGLMPRLLAIPSVRQLQAVVQSLEAEVGRRHSAEEHVQELEQDLALTLASIDAGFIATDREGRVTQMNAVAERVTGWGLADARGKPLWTVFERADVDATDAAGSTGNAVDGLLPAVVGQRQTFAALARARGSGELTPTEARATLTHADDGSVRGLAMVFRDMTRVNQAEAELRRLAAVVESSRDAIITKTLNGRITSWNGAATALFGYTAEQAIGMPVQRLIPPERLDEEMRVLTDLAHGHTVPAFDTVRLASDGRRVEVSITISPLRDASGRIVGGSKIARDITARRQVEAALHESQRARERARQLEAENRQILEASRLKSQFVANMSHELRTPLNAIIGFAELMHAGIVPAGSPRRQEYLGHIAKSGRHLLRLINDVLDLSKIEAGRVDFNPAPLDLGQLVADVTDVLQTALRDKQLAVQVDIAEGLGPLVLDESRLRQVLFNYLSNAIKFTPDGGRIRVVAQAEGDDQVRIEVEDSGIGIAPQDLPRLFVEFQQLDAGTDKRHQGTGLGLALTRRLVQAQGGSVGVRSTPGRGSVFHLILPSRGQAAPGAAAPPVADSGGRRRVLVIEPDPVQQVQLLQGARTLGLGADEAGTGDQALRRAGQHGYDAITLGLQLPDQQGLLALAHIRSGGPSRQSPVVGVSLLAPPAGAASFGVADVLFKPLRSAEVTLAMSRLPRPAERPARVLVVDDDPLALDLMRSTLEALGLEVLCLGDGRQALARLDTLRPDAMVLDLMMPDVDGFEVLAALRALPAWQGLPVFVWTSMLLTDAEVERLTRSARAIVGQGGGAVDAVIDGLRQLRGAVA